MLHTSTNENKAKNEVHSIYSEPVAEPEHCLSAPGWMGQSLLRSWGSGLPIGSLPMQHRDRLNHLQKTYGNQAVLRSLNNASPTTSSVFLQRKCSCGGTPGPTGECAACRAKRLQSKAVLQPKLTVGAANDQYEQEADLVAKQVMRMPEPTIQRQVDLKTAEGLTSQTKQITNSIMHLQCSSISQNHPSEAPSLVHDVLRSSGQPLNSATRAFMEPRFCQNFSQVRVHTDAKAAESAAAVNALAYTVGRDMVFGTGQYVPETKEGQQLLAHELTHVVQQSESSTVHPSAGRLPVGATDISQEQASTLIAETVLPHAPRIQSRLPLIGTAVPFVQRQTAPNAENESVLALTSAERLLLYTWLSRWRIDTEPGRLLLGPQLGADHGENIQRLAEAIWSRRLSAEARPDPRLLLGNEPLPEEASALADGPVRETYNEMIRQGEQQLSVDEEDFIQLAMAARSFSSINGRVQLNDDVAHDTSALAETLLCARVSMLLDDRIDPLLCLDHQVTITNPIFAAFRATVIAPFYTSIRPRLGQELAQAMAEGRFSAGAHEYQVRQIAQTGMVRSQGQTVLPSVRLLKLIEALAAQSTPRTGRQQRDFQIVSLIRPNNGPHGSADAGGMQIGRAVDIVRYAGHSIDIASPQEAVQGVAAVIRALPAGCYGIGLPRPPRTDPDGGFIDAQRHQRFYMASVLQGETPVLHPRGQAAIANNPFLPAVNINHSPAGSIDGDLAALGAAGREALEPAVREAQESGANVLFLFPDGPDHLHIQVETCRGVPSSQAGP